MEANDYNDFFQGFDMTSFNDCPYEIVEGRSDFLEELFMPTIKKGIEAVRTWDGCQEVADVLEKNFSIFPTRIRDIFLNGDKRLYSVLIHADFHFKNLMYRNDGFKSEDFLLVINDILY